MNCAVAVTINNSVRTANRTGFFEPHRTARPIRTEDRTERDTTADRARAEVRRRDGHSNRSHAQRTAFSRCRAAALHLDASSVIRDTLEAAGSAVRGTETGYHPRAAYR